MVSGREAERVVGGWEGGKGQWEVEREVEGQKGGGSGRKPWHKIE